MRACAILRLFECMNLACPNCRSTVPLEDVNVSTDIALCRKCGKTFSFSENVASTADSVPVLNTPPSGAWFEHLPEGFRAGASTRSWIAVVLIPFTCVWAGGSLSGIYGSQIKKGQLDPASSLFGLPFLIGSIVLVTMCVMALAGKVEITKAHDQLTLFLGVGPLGWSRRFLWSDFSRVREETRWGNRGLSGQGQTIVLEGTRRVAFGSMLNDERRYFLLNVFQTAFRDRLT